MPVENSLIDNFSYWREQRNFKASLAEDPASLREERRKKWQDGFFFKKNHWKEAFRLYQHLAKLLPRSIKDLKAYSDSYDILTPVNRWDFPTRSKYSVVKNNISPLVNYPAIILDSFIKGNMSPSLFLKQVEELENIDPEVNIWQNLEVTEPTFGIEELGDNVFHHLAKYAAIDSEFLKSKQGAATLERLNAACGFLALQGGLKAEPNHSGCLPSEFIPRSIPSLKTNLRNLELRNGAN